MVSRRRRSPARIKQDVTQKGVQVSQILLTHGHLDHVGVPVGGTEKEDECLLQGLPQQSRMLGLDECQPLTPDRWLKEEERVSVGNVTLQMLHCPGHIVFCTGSDKI